MISLPSLSQLDRAASTRIWLCTGPTDMRRGFDRLARLGYDGVGRLITNTVYRNGTTQVEHYYYDGIRRMQEV